jgi:ectoine hydroxylase-related dioxygenase (phytanoyl-CoA dioxygenase family)
MPLTGKQTHEFDDKGFVVLKSFFDKPVMEKISGWLDELRDDEDDEVQGSRFYEKSATTGENILVRVEDVFGDQNAKIAELLISPNALDCLTGLFGEPPILFKEKINYKLPGCRADKLHQDQAAGWNRYCDYFITMGIVVDPNRLENAALSFMNSGSYEKELMTEEWRPMTDDDPPYEPRKEYILLESDPGDVIFFDSYVPHGSPPNTGDKSRRNIFLTFNRRSDGDMRDRYYADKRLAYPPNNSSSARAEESFRV